MFARWQMHASVPMIRRYVGKWLVGAPNLINRKALVGLVRARAALHNGWAVVEFIRRIRAVMKSACRRRCVRQRCVLHFLPRQLRRDLWLWMIWCWMNPRHV